MGNYRDKARRSTYITWRDDRLITLRLTRSELTSLLHALEVAKDEARKAMLFAQAPRSPAYPQARPDMQERQRAAAAQTYLDVSELCDLVTDIWGESHPSQQG